MEPTRELIGVDAGIFHDFHLEWISRIKGALNSGILPLDYYAPSPSSTRAG